ncbi:hypothetical protein LTR84_010762 [Exophiala bonariae]|uniref:Xylanolytic transcriptional activator regulatory domain-containing protein n=1 Tax=Exophiala bonariae TaxID=1690606 RepID=A0AAV9MV63_9EURO|nr:hypothetical protein LTR84_010762 [Exophiala bonariae]
MSTVSTESPPMANDKGNGMLISQQEKPAPMNLKLPDTTADLNLGGTTRPPPPLHLADLREEFLADTSTYSSLGWTLDAHDLTAIDMPTSSSNMSPWRTLPALTGAEAALLFGEQSAYLPFPDSILEHADSNSFECRSLEDGSLELQQLPLALMKELWSIDHYFDKVHSFVPILHKYHWVEAWLGDPSRLRATLKTNSPSSLLVHMVFALAARFSLSPYFEREPPSERGQRIAAKATAIYWDCLQSLQQPDLVYLQGCTLLAWYLYLSGPNLQGWLTIGTCTRLAYEMGIDKIDATNGDVPLTLDWSQQEEQRRVWWSIWELDTFASAIACRPHTIDRLSMAVKLPVSDADWLADNSVESVVIDPDPLNAWYTLRDSANQDERAWFLLCNYLLLIAYGLGRQSNVSDQSILEIEKAVTCFALLLPKQFHLHPELGSLSFGPKDFIRSNWIISTNIMLQGCLTFIRFLQETVSRGDPNPLEGNNLLSPLAGESHYSHRRLNYERMADNLLQIMQMWPAEYIAYNSPFIGCLMLGPAGMNVRVALQREKSAKCTGNRPNIDIEMLRLALSQISRYWKIGDEMLALLSSITGSELSS